MATTEAPALVDVDGDGIPDRVTPGRGSIWSEVGNGTVDVAGAEPEAPGTDLAERPAAEVVDPVDTVTDLVPVDPPPNQRGDLSLRISSLMDAPRKPIIPTWLSSKEDRQAIFGWALEYTGYLLAFHLVHVWGDLAKALVIRAPRGIATGVKRTSGWVGDTQADPIIAELVRIAVGASAPVVEAAAARHSEMTKARGRRRRARGICLVVAAVPVLTWVAILVTVAPRWATVLTGTGLVGFFAWLGRPRDVPFFSRAVDSSNVGPRRLTSEMIETAFAYLGISGLNQALKPGGMGLGFPEPIRMDEGSRGWRADIDLPLGVTPDMVLGKRAELASALRRPMGTVWPEGDPDVHGGRLILRVLHKDFANQKQPAWPLAKAGTYDFFDPFPFGWDVRGRLVTLPMFEANMLIGAQPGEGKSASIRTGLAAAALDPTCELWIAELAGKGDFAAFADISHVYINGVHKEALAEAAQMLSDLRGECERRLTVLGTKVPAEMKPDMKVTREIANRKAWRLYPIKAVLDECQNLFKDPVFGKQAGEDAEAIQRLSRAVAVRLVLATQRPDGKSVPTGVSAQSHTRFCLRVAGQIENDMILGTSMYQNGYRATLFRHEKDAGIGILVGGDDLPITVRAAYLDGPAVKRIVARARALREAAGTITGHGAGQERAKPQDRYQLLRDILAVWPTGQDRMWSEELCVLLEDTFPDRWSRLNPTRFASLLVPFGIKTRQMVKSEHKGPDGKVPNRYGLDLTTVQQALQDRGVREEVTV